MTIQAKRVSSMYTYMHEMYSTKLVVFDNWKETDKYLQTGAQVNPYQTFCIPSSFRYHIGYQKMAYFSFVLETSGPTWFSLTADMLKYEVLGECLVSNATNNCSIDQQRFANEAVVCITATARDSDSDIEYGIIKATVPLWKKVIHFFIFTTIIVLVSIPYWFILYVLCVPLGLVKYRICHFFHFTLLLLSLATVIYGLYSEIDFFVKLVHCELQL